MVQFTIADVEQAIDAFAEHSGGFDKPRAVAAANLIAGTLRPLASWLKAMPDVQLTSYLAGGYTCIGFQLNGSEVRGVKFHLMETFS